MAIKTNLDGWKYPKAHIDEVYGSHNTILSSEFFKPSFWSKAKKLFRIPSYVIKDFEKTVTLKASDKNVSFKFLKGLFKFRNKGYVHLGLIQIAIKPVISSDGMEGPVIVCLRDDRYTSIEPSLLAVVEADLCEGPLYFNCCPGYSICLEDYKYLTLSVRTSGVPLALTYRVVCKVSTDVTLDVRKSIRGETTYFQPMATSETESTTKWDQVQFPESWKNSVS